MSLFDDARESQKSAKKALSVYIRRLENAINNQMVKDPIKPGPWTMGVAPAIWIDNDISIVPPKLVECIGGALQPRRPLADDCVNGLRDL